MDNEYDSSPLTVEELTEMERHNLRRAEEVAIGWESGETDTGVAAPASIMFSLLALVAGQALNRISTPAPEPNGYVE